MNLGDKIIFNVNNYRYMEKSDPDDETLSEPEYVNGEVGIPGYMRG